MTRRVTVMVVTYHSAGEVEQALTSAMAAAKSANVEVEFIVVDNASADTSVEVVERTAPQAHVIRNTVNVGFGSANNQAFEIASGDAWLLLNPDARLEPEALGILLRFFDMHPKAATVAPSIAGGGAQDRSFKPGGAESAGMLPGIRSAIGHFLFINRLLPGDRGGAFRGFQLTRRPALGARRVDWASGAVALLRPAAIREVGGFDARIFLYGEDTELGERLGKAGWEAWLVPEAHAWHAIAASQGGISTRWMDHLHSATAQRSGRFRTLVFDLVVACGLLIRAGAARGNRPETKVHRRRMARSAMRALRLASTVLTPGFDRRH